MLLISCKNVSFCIMQDFESGSNVIPKLGSAEEKHTTRGYNDVIEKQSNYNYKLKGNNISQSKHVQTKKNVRKSFIKIFF